jgi:hypothetical protein
MRLQAPRTWIKAINCHQLLRLAGEVLSLLDNETGMRSCLDSKPKLAGWRRRQEEASPWRREYRALAILGGRLTTSGESVTRSVRAPDALAAGLDARYSVSRSGATSGMWIIRPSRTARPTMESRRSGAAKVGGDVCRVLYQATRRTSFASTKAMLESLAPHTRTAFSATTSTPAAGRSASSRSRGGSRWWPSAAR